LETDEEVVLKFVEAAFIAIVDDDKFAALKHKDEIVCDGQLYVPVELIGVKDERVVEALMVETSDSVLDTVIMSPVGKNL